LSASGRRRIRGEKGYALVLAALMLLPLLAFAGFATDVGAWYARASRIQRAADAASLAGVVWMPDLAQARTVALATATRNGFTSGQDNITITVTADATSTRKLRVVIQDSAVDQFFSSLFIGPVTVTRAATSEYILPVPLGSPYNSFGNDPTIQPPTAQSNPNLWGAINGPFENMDQGDPYAARCTHGTTGCATTTNSSYRDTGYTYAVDCTNCTLGTTLTVQVYDAGYYTRVSANTETGDHRPGSGNPTAGVRTLFELFGSDPTPLDNTDNPSLAGQCGTGFSGTSIAPDEGTNTYKNTWRTLCTVSVTTKGVFPLHVQTSDIPGFADAGRGTNQYSLKATTSTGTAPRIYALGDMSMFNNVAGTSDFYLAEVDQIHAGKTFQISLYDPGESSGNAWMSVKRPDGTTPPCTYRNRTTGTSTTLATCRIQTSNGSGLFDGDWLDIDVALPTNYACTLGALPGCWWKINYEFPTGTPTDRTTWSAQIIGDPVHLTRDG
jgi:hypothetical protein